MACLTSKGVIDGFFSRYKAATPVTTGVDILVPDSVFEAVLEPYQALVTPVPGLHNIFEAMKTKNLISDILIQGFV
jgi:hypothetical protein